MLTEEKLVNSPEFKQWIKGRVSLIHNCYYDAKEPYGSFIVLTSDLGKFTITRFFEMADKLQVSVDHKDVSTEEMFKILLSEYSRGLV